MDNVLKRKINPKSHHDSPCKKMLLEEVSDTSDILECISQSESFVDTFLQRQQEGLAKALLLNFCQRNDSKEKESPLVLKISPTKDNKRQDKEAHQGQGSPMTSIREIDKLGSNQLANVVVAETRKHTDNLSYKLVQSSDVTRPESDQVVYLQNHDSDSIKHITLQGDSVVDQSQFVIYDDSGQVIEIQDEHQNQIFLPPALQQHILNLLSFPSTTVGMGTSTGESTASSGQHVISLNDGSRNFQTVEVVLPLLPLSDNQNSEPEEIDA